MAKDMVRTADWVNLRSNGYPALEHPPMFEWMQASLFLVFGFSDGLARLPAAVCGFGVILLVFWLARKLSGDPVHATLAMFVMATSIYFLKYSARAMTDVPFTFFFLCAVCAWSLSEEDPRWYLATGVCMALALMTRSLMGMALPIVFALHAVATRRRPPLRYAVPALVMAFLPLVSWYVHLISLYRGYFFTTHSTWLENEVYGSLSPSWRRFTGAFEYAWMLSKSYWPWLPFMIAGLAGVIRSRDRRLFLLVFWPAVVFVLCSVTRSRVLRYMLPAYPAFAILAALGLLTLVPIRILNRVLRTLTPVLAAVVLALAVFPRTHPNAAEIQPIARAATAATSVDERVAFYDAGQSRWDETNQLQWYGDRYLTMLFDHQKFIEALHQPRVQVLVVDKGAYHTYIDSHIAHQVLADSGHLICVRVYPAGAPASTGS